MGINNKNFEKKANKGMLDVLFLQTDLKNHSKWFHDSESKPYAVKARSKFADKLNKELNQKHNFNRLYWFGDGGMFYTLVTGLKNFDSAIIAADKTFKTFSKWKAGDKNREILQLRVSIHYPSSPVYTHSYPGYWTSEDLNVFSKFEREIAIPGTTAITDRVYPHLSRAFQKRFPKTTERDFRVIGTPKETLIQKIYYDIGHSPPKYPLEYPFVTFLHKFSKELDLTTDKKIGPTSAVSVEFGQTIVLYGANSPLENIKVFLKQLAPPLSNKLTVDDEKELNKRAKSLRKDLRDKNQRDKKKVSPLRMVFPLTDFPVLAIEYYSESWSNSRTFQAILEADQSQGTLWSRLAKKAADTQVSGIGYPGILCMHMLIRTAPSEDGKRFVVLCQRNKRGPKGFFHEGKWSCSIEEQVTPGEEIEDCVMRGIAEELLGPQIREHLESKIFAAFLERNLLNLTLLAAVDVPLFYKEIVRRWMRDAVDKNEHRQIVALPVQKDIIMEIIKSGKISPKAKKDCLVFDKQKFDEDTKVWDLHPSSPLRLALALWLESSIKTK